MHSKFAKMIQKKWAVIRSRWLRRLHLDFYLAGYNAGIKWDCYHEPKPKKPNILAFDWNKGLRVGIGAQGFNAGYYWSPEKGERQPQIPARLPAILAAAWHDGFRNGVGLAQWEERWSTPD